MIMSSHRFHGRNSLRFVYQHGRMVRDSQVSLRFVRNTREQRYRAAVVVSRKVSKSAVVRNRIRRRLFEAIRRESGRLNGPYDLVFAVGNDQLAEAESKDVDSIVRTLFDQAGICKTAQAETPSHAIVESKER